jgi:hypothetical protein
MQHGKDAMQRKKAPPKVEFWGQWFNHRAPKVSTTDFNKRNFVPFSF